MTTHGAAAETKGSIYEREARSRKVLRLTMAIDHALDMWKLDPFGPAALEAVLSMDEKAWAQALRNAGLESASETTRGEVVSVYAQRVEVRVALRRIPLRAGGAR